MSILSDIWDGVRTTLAGLKVTVPYIWRKPVTTMYPHQRLELPERTRNRLYVNMDDCIGCDQCARACPVNCIEIETVKAVEGDSPGLTSDGRKKALWVTKFDIDIAKCCYCGLCTYPCPTECIKMTDVFEFAEQERNNLIYNYITMTPDEIREKIAAAEADAAAQAARKAAAKAAAASPAPAAPATPPAGTGVPPGTDPEKAAKIAELQAKMAAAKAKREGESPVVQPTPSPQAPAIPVPPGTDPEKAAKIAELQAKMAAAKAKREAEASAAGPAASGASAGDAPSTGPAPAPPAAPVAPAETGVTAAEEGVPPAPSDEDAGKAARIAAMKEKIEALKRQRGES